MTRDEAIQCIKHELMINVNRADLTGQAIGEALDMAISALELVTINADSNEIKVTNCNYKDTIYRQDVIELVKNSYYNLAESIEDTWAMVADVEKLPSAQSEIVRCKDCVHFSFCQRYGCKEDDFCSYAERRTDGER